MILADKIINERKKNGWSQEELAEKLSVSRQSVSKWEGAQAVPDLQKLLKMAEIFNVSTDYLLKDEMEPEQVRIENTSVNAVVEAVAEPPLRKVSMEEANKFLTIEKKYSGWMAIAVSLCVISPIALLLLSTLAEVGKIAMKTEIATALGLGILLFIIAPAVGIFIFVGKKREPFEFLEREAIETEYGVSGMVKEKKAAYENRHSFYIILGVVLCILSAVPLLFSALVEAEEYVVIVMVCILLVMVSVACNFFVRSSIIMESYEKLLQEKDFAPKQKKANSVMEKVASIYWLLVTGGYLAWSFTGMDWDKTWIVWPIAGIVFAVIAVIIKTVMKADE